jgi:hypothetical protein
MRLMVDGTDAGPAAAAVVAVREAPARPPPHPAAASTSPTPITPRATRVETVLAIGDNSYAMAKRDPRMVHLGYGRWVRADRVYAVVPLQGEERGDGRRTYVHVDGLGEPLVASRSERAILADVEAALAEAAGVPRRARASGSQDGLF